MTNQNSIQEGIKCRLKAEIHVIIQYVHFCLLDFSLKNLKIKRYEIIILSVVPNGYEARSLTLREERRLRVFEFEQDPEANI